MMTIVVPSRIKFHARVKRDGVCAPSHVEMFIRTADPPPPLPLSVNPVCVDPSIYCCALIASSTVTISPSAHVPPGIVAAMMFVSAAVFCALVSVGV
jgi:hypothetical protein